MKIFHRTHIYQILLFCILIPTHAFALSFHQDRAHPDSMSYFQSIVIEEADPFHACLSDPFLPDHIEDTIIDNPPGESFMFLDFRLNAELYYPAIETAKPGFLLLMGTGMMGLAVFSRRMIQ